EPLQPVIDVLTAPIPVISDLARSPVTLIDIAGMTGYVKADLIYAIADVVTLVNSFPDFEEEGALILPFADFVIYDKSGGVGTGFNLFDANFDRKQVARPNVDIGAALGDLANNTPDGSAKTAAQFTNGLAGKNFGDFISFPIFEDPSQIFGLLMGDDISLIEIDLPPLDFKFTYSQFFSIFGPLGVSITGTLGAMIGPPA